jgi:hypothetical protein
VLAACSRAIDRRLAVLLLRRARRAWPMLRLLPDSWGGPLLVPIAGRLRRSLAHTALTTGAPLVLVLALAVLLVAT